ncbi:hypothetical protein MRB53_001769 [Persea americana]|uniref:Uncharacterized protein n=1 Tax=Persea americana TaxID=3435 RepID=A0ACC2MSM9_PERAE|nr:hypothetical protein MRB53_001769 [Persea americana]
MASCVCKSWSAYMSSDHLWKPLCLSHYPSLSSLRLIDPTVSYRRLFSLGHTAANRDHRPHSKPHISLSDLLFTIDVFHNDSLLLSLAKSSDELDRLDTDRQSGVFHFGVSVEDVAAEVPRSGEGLKVAWTAVLKGWRGVFSLIDCKGNGKLVGGRERWFSEELPAPGCCGAVATGGMGVVAEVGLEFCGGVGEGKMKVEKVSMGLLSIVSWRYLSVEDGLRYLHYFLLPSNV